MNHHESLFSSWGWAARDWRPMHTHLVGLHRVATNAPWGNVAFLNKCSGPICQHFPTLANLIQSSSGLASPSWAQYRPWCMARRAVLCSSTVESPSYRSNISSTCSRMCLANSWTPPQRINNTRPAVIPSLIEFVDGFHQGWIAIHRFGTACDAQQQELDAAFEVQKAPWQCWMASVNRRPHWWSKWTCTPSAVCRWRVERTYHRDHVHTGPDAATRQRKFTGKNHLQQSFHGMFLFRFRWRFHQPWANSTDWSKLHSTRLQKKTEHESL